MGLKLRIKEVEGYVLSGLLYYLCSKNKGLISCAVSLQLICTFVFAYAKIRFSHDMAQTTAHVAVSDSFVVLDLSLVVRKQVFRVSDQVQHKPGCTTTDDG